MSLSVLLVDVHSTRCSTLRAALEEAGFRVVGVLADDPDLYEAVERMAPDAVLVDADSPSRDTLEHLAMLGQRYPKPMLMLSPRDDRQSLAAAADAGVSSYVVEGVSPALVRSLVEVAVRQYQDVEALRQERDEARADLAGRKVIDRAKSLLMERHGLSERDAYRRIRKAAMDRGLPMVEMARSVLERSAD